ncbi:MAG TPA: efflux transporter outer membrane subunit [Gemmatimonadales bacterium]
MRKAILWGFAALYGCAAAPSYRSPAVPPPAAFRAVAAESAQATAYIAPVADAPSVPTTDDAVSNTPSDYWDQLDDTTLSRLVREVSRTNLDVQAARARVSAASSDRVRSILDLTPSATVSGGYARQRYSSSSFPGATGVLPDQDIWSTSVDASWDLDLFGQIRHGVQARGALQDVAEEQLRDVQVTLTAELASAYFELRGAQEQLAVARQNAENQKKTLELTQQRANAGRGSAFDTERAQAQLSSTLATIPAREAQVAAAQYRIGTLVGRSPTAVAQELADAAPLPALPDVTTIANPETVVRYRPDVASAERFAAAEGALVGAAKASYLPRIAIGGSAGYLAPEFNSVGDRSTWRYAIGPVITWPGLNLGRVKAEVDAASAREHAARAQYSQAVLVAVQDVETSLSRYRAARAQVERLREASAASERAADLARLRYGEGATDLLAVLDAQRTELEAQDRLAQGRTEAATAYAALYRALGGTSGER